MSTRAAAAPQVYTRGIPCPARVSRTHDRPVPDFMTPLVFGLETFPTPFEAANDGTSKMCNIVSSDYVRLEGIPKQSIQVCGICVSMCDKVHSPKLPL